MLSSRQRKTKRLFDLIFAVLGLLITLWLLALGWLLASLSTRSNGFFIQERIGQNGRVFKVIKLKTMKNSTGSSLTTVTAASDSRITPVGKVLRRTKIDELPQLFNVLIGQMSFVGPRPDVPGFADQLSGEDRKILTLKPGITGPASLKYRNEEEILASVLDPEEYNLSVIWPDKVKVNKEYMESWSIRQDIKYILKTIFPHN